MAEEPIVQAKLVIPSASEHLPRVRELVETTATQIGFSIGEVQRIVTAVFEAVVNAATHGSPLGSKNTISLDIRAYSDRLVVEVQDQGPGFRDSIPQKMPDANAARGRGIPLMHALVDEVELINGNGGKVILTKYRR